MRVVAGLLVTLLMQACSMDNKEPALHFVHPNGLSLRLPIALSAQQLPDGFIVDLAASRESRTPEQVTVVLHKGASEPEGEWPDKRVVSGRVFSYRMEQDKGGSGGEVYVLVAWCPYPGGYVRLEQVSQAEWPTVPNESLIWNVTAAISEPQSR
jgi:hypothetical protein